MPRFKNKDCDELNNTSELDILSGTFRFMKQGDQLGNVEFGDDPKAPHRKNRRAMLAGNPGGEVGEFLDADFANDMIEYIDGTIDTAVVAIGGLLEAVNGRPEVASILIKEVCRSNLSKFGEDGKPIKNDEGKVLKGPNYSPPRIREILDYFGIEIPEESTHASFMAFKEPAGVKIPNPMDEKLESRRDKGPQLGNYKAPGEK